MEKGMASAGIIMLVTGGGGALGQIKPSGTDNKNVCGRNISELTDRSSEYNDRDTGIVHCDRVGRYQ